MSFNGAFRMFLVVSFLKTAFSRSTSLIDSASGAMSLPPSSDYAVNSDIEDMPNGVTIDTRDEEKSKDGTASNTIGDGRVIGSYGAPPAMGSQRIGAGYGGSDFSGRNIDMGSGLTRFGDGLSNGIGGSVGYGGGSMRMGTFNGEIPNRGGFQGTGGAYGVGVSRFNQGRNFNLGSLYGDLVRRSGVEGGNLRSGVGYGGSFTRRLNVNVPMWNRRVDSYNVPIMDIETSNQPNPFSRSLFRSRFGGYDKGAMGSNINIRSGLNPFDSNGNFDYQRGFYPARLSTGVNDFSGNWRSGMGDYSSVIMPPMSGLSNDVGNQGVLSNAMSPVSGDTNNAQYESSSLSSTIDTGKTDLNNNENALMRLGLHSNNKFDANLIQSNSKPSNIIEESDNGDNRDKGDNLYGSSSATGGLDDTVNSNTMESNYQPSPYAMFGSNSGYRTDGGLSSNGNALQSQTNYLYNAMSNRYPVSAGSNGTPLNYVRHSYNPLSVGNNEDSLVNNGANQGQWGSTRIASSPLNDLTLSDS